MFHASLDLIATSYSYFDCFKHDWYIPHTDTYAAQPGYQPVPTQQFNAPPAYTPQTGYAPAGNQQVQFHPQVKLAKHFTKHSLPCYSYIHGICNSESVLDVSE